MFRVLDQGDGQQDLSMVADSGWSKYGPRLLYQYITSFLCRMQRLVNESADLDLEAISGDGGLSPYSLNEFHDLLAKEYGSVLTNGDSTQKAVVYHTTPAKRIRNVGWYHVFEYNCHPIATIPDPIQNQMEVAPKSPNSTADRFWCNICSTYADGFSLSIGHVLLGKLILTHFPDVLQNGYISAVKVQELQKKNISNDYTLEFLFPDFRQFAGYVRNCVKKTLKWRFLSQTSGSEKHILLRKKEICSNFQMECTDEGLNADLQDAIQHAINERNLRTLISVGFQGMNSEYILFLHGLHIFFIQQRAVLCRTGMKTQEATAHLRKLWFSEDYVLPDSI